MTMTFETIINYYNDKNELSNKIWIWIAIISIFGLVVMLKPIVLTDINFPGIDFKIPIDYFLPIYLAVISGIIIKWGDVYHRAVSLRQDIIQKFLTNENEEIEVEGIKINLLELAYGVFYPTTLSAYGVVPKFKKYKLATLSLHIFTYAILKLIIFTAHFGLPTLAIVLPVVKLDSSLNSILLKIFIYFIALAGIGTLIITAYTETKITYIVVKKQINKYIIQKKAQNSTGQKDSATNITQEQDLKKTI